MSRTDSSDHTAELGDDQPDGIGSCDSSRLCRSVGCSIQSIIMQFFRLGGVPFGLTSETPHGAVATQEGVAICKRVIDIDRDGAVKVFCRPDIGECGRG